MPEDQMLDDEFRRQHLELVNQKLIDKIAELEEANRDRTKLLVDLVKAQESERSRIAGDIHDDSIQIMAAVALRLEMLGDDLPDASQRAVVDTVTEKVRQAVVRLRRLVFDLSPRALENGGVAVAIETYLREVAIEGGFEWRFENASSGQLPEEVGTVLYRIAQEAIRNAQKHAKARHVHVTLDEIAGGTTLRIADDGIGVAPDRAREYRPGHLGLASMRERAAMAGGRFELESAPGAGCTVDVWVPGAVSGAGAHASTGGGQ
jgi:signal transduction histidine kinase